MLAHAKGENVSFATLRQDPKSKIITEHVMVSRQGASAVCRRGRNPWARTH